MCRCASYKERENDNLYSVYKYNGSLIIDRHLANNIIDDVIENTKELKSEICEFFYNRQE